MKLCLYYHQSVNALNRLPESKRFLASMTPNCVSNSMRTLLFSQFHQKIRLFSKSLLELKGWKVKKNIYKR
jgi:hypothetical protein